jgi:NAD(P)H-dependent FMN reductase
MITVISGTNRPGSNTRKIAVLIEDMIRETGHEVALLDLHAIPDDVFASSSYASKPDSFAVFQDQILAAEGVLTVVPEYNGSFPGVLKYFIDMLRFPESLYEMPAAFIGISSGRWGGLRAVEHLEMVFQYRHAHLFGRRCFIPGVGRILDENGQLTDSDVEARLQRTAADFARFCRKLVSGQE